MREQQSVWLLAQLAQRALLLARVRREMRKRDECSRSLRAFAAVVDARTRSCVQGRCCRLTKETQYNIVTVLVAIEKL